MSMWDQAKGQLVGGIGSMGNQSAAMKEQYEHNRIFAQQGVGTAAPPVQTLASALQHIAELNKRLYGLKERTHQLASLLGGPFPIGSGAESNEAKQPSAMEKLNQDISLAHALVSDVEQCVGAMGRSLGSNT